MIYNDYVGLGRDNLETGGAVEARGKPLVLQGMSRLVRTPVASYPLDASLGNAAWDYIHLPMTEAVARLLTYSSVVCLATYEPRVETSVDATVEAATVNNEDGSITTPVAYRWLDEPFTILAPLQLTGGG